MEFYKNKKISGAKYYKYKNSRKSRNHYSRYNNTNYKLKLYASNNILEDLEEEKEEKMYSRWRSLLLPAIVILPSIIYLKHMAYKNYDMVEQTRIEQVESKIPETRDKIDSTKKETKNEVIDFFKKVVKWQMSTYEGGYSDDPNDPGNYYKNELWGTNHGISASFAAGLGLTKEELKSLTIDKAADILVNYASHKLNTNPDTTSKDFILIYSLYCFYYGKERAYIPLLQHFGYSSFNGPNAEKVLSEEILDKNVAESLKKYFEELLLRSFQNDLNRPIPIYSFGWYRRYVETLEHWKKQGYTTLEPSPEFLEKAGDILKQIREKQILARKAQVEQKAQQEQQPDTMQLPDVQKLSPQELELQELELQGLESQELSPQPQGIASQEVAEVKPKPKKLSLIGGENSELDLD